MNNSNVQDMLAKTLVLVYEEGNMLIFYKFAVCFTFKAKGHNLSYF